LLARVGTHALRLLVAFIPSLLVIAILHFRYDTNIYEHVPIWNDEVGYWHQAATFAAVGFQGGYYALDENPAPAAWTRFDVHGPWYPMIYGTIGRLLGEWELYTPVVINLLLYTLAVCVFIYTVQPNFVQLVVMGLILASAHPILLYLPTAMSEGLQAAVGLLIAAIFWRLLSRRVAGDGNAVVMGYFAAAFLFVGFSLYLARCSACFAGDGHYSNSSIWDGGMGNARYL